MHGGHSVSSLHSVYTWLQTGLTDATAFHGWGFLKPDLSVLICAICEKNLPQLSLQPRDTLFLGKSLKGPINLAQITRPEKIQMNQQRIEITNLPLFAIVFWKWEMVIIGIVKNFLESAEQSRHGKVHASMSKINRGIDEDGFRFFIAHEVPAPQIAVQQCRWFRTKYIRQSREDIFKRVDMFSIEETIFPGQFYLRMEPCANKKIIPFLILIIVLNQRAHIIIFIKSEQRLTIFVCPCLSMKSGELSAK